MENFKKTLYKMKTLLYNSTIKYLNKDLINDSQ